MEWNEATTLELADRVNGFASVWSAEQAEAEVAAKVAEARAPFTVNGIDSTPAVVVAEHDAAARQQWDREAAKAGLDIELKLMEAAVILGDGIERKKVLPPTVEPLLTRQERQTEELVALLSRRELGDQFARSTRREALDVYRAADETQQDGRRLVTFLEAQWSTLAFRDDPEHDAIAISQWHAARDARRLARVPKDLLAQHERVTRAQRHLTFTETLRHLRSGRGIAVRPKPTTLRIA